MRRCLQLIGLAAGLALGSAGCGASGTAASSSSTTLTTSTRPGGAPAGKAGNLTNGQGVISSVPFIAGSAFVQYDPSQKGWWVVVAGAGHACSEVTAATPQISGAMVPNVNTFLPAATSETLPPGGAQMNRGVTLNSRSGYPTTLNGAGTTIAITHAQAAPGGHWSGNIVAPTQSFDGKSFGFRGTFTATVCPPAKG